ncbi:hypothetical protein QN277_001032 [Acacia crassicarpa]|uniref:ATP-dependent Clp protease proteolytic subunit n=1 Tax=Acacia crassicarpa TaxID=499986 RepID=A0AAE1TGD8_9FABA|nr:hypothetical protein QN277_001032 [Acacia crassicarpa]
MEVSVTCATSKSRPMCFNRGLLPSQIRSFTAIKTTDSIATGRNSKGRRKSISVANAFNESTASRHTLSSNWDVDLCQNYSATPAQLLPRFEELDTTNMLLRQRIVFLGSPVDDMTADFVISQLLLLDVEDPKKDIKLFINSPGGSITAAMGIYDAMKLCKADISTICVGLAASTGAFILASGTKGKRFCMPNGRVMIHQPLGSSSGGLAEICISIRELSYQKTKINKILSRVTGKSLEQIEEDTYYDKFMNAWEAKEYGLIDGVIDDGKPGLIAPVAEAIPPPQPYLLGLFNAEGLREAKKKMPSEHKFLQKALEGGQISDGDKDPEQAKETPSAV